MWLFYSVLAGALFTAQGLITRHFLRAKHDPWAFSFFFSLIGTIVTLPFMLSDPKLPHSTADWLLAAVVGLLIVGNNLLVFSATGQVGASIMGAIANLRLVWVFVFSIILLHGSFHWLKLAGTLLVVTAGFLIIKKRGQVASGNGIGLAVSATAFNAAIILLSKYLLGPFNVVSFTFFAAFLAPAIFNYGLMPKATSRIRKLFSTHWKEVTIACSLGAFSNLALYQALALHDANSVVVINAAFLLVVLVGEHVLLKERESGWLKAATVVLAVLGAILIQVR